MRNAAKSLLAIRDRPPARHPWRRLLPQCLTLALVAVSCERAREAPAPPDPQPPAIARASPPPDIAAAGRIIAESAEFGEFEFTSAALSLPLQTSMMNEPARAAAKDLAAAGWIAMSDGSVKLSDKAATDRRFITRPNGFVDMVPLAKKEFLGVSALKPQSDGTVTAEFTWQWMPNEIAKSFRGGEIKSRFEGERDATATLMWDGSAWTVLRITKQAA